LDAGGDAGSAPEAGAAVEDVEEAEPRYLYVGACEGIYVYIVTVSVQDPTQSTASLSLSGTGRGLYRRVGDRIGQFEVMAIHDDWTGLDPKVWLRKGDEVCHATLEGNDARQKAAAQRAAARKRKKAAALKRKRAARRRRKQRRRRARRRRR
jgi:hypothetical protein